MTDTLTDLIGRLESAAEGSRRLSDDCLLATGWTFKQYEARRRKVPYDWVTPDGKGIVEYGHQPDVTRDLADAIEWLVPDGMEFSFTNIYGIARVEMGLNVNDGGPWYADREDGDISLTFCAAALKARARLNEME